MADTCKSFLETSMPIWNRYRLLNDIYNRCEAVLKAMLAAALLLMHCLRHPFGVNDEPVQVMSTAFLSYFEITLAAIYILVRFIDLALLVTCMEVRDANRNK